MKDPAAQKIDIDSRVMCFPAHTDIVYVGRVTELHEPDYVGIVVTATTSRRGADTLRMKVSRHRLAVLH